MNSRTRRLQIMGVVNVTPDSFYAGGRAATAKEATDLGLRLAAEGADILDIGGESTRPGAEPVLEEEECRRVIPVIETLSRQTKIPISIDTSKAGVARRALEAGAVILNDVTALSAEPRMMEVARDFGQVILMHMQGRPRTMQDNPRYGDVVGDILDFMRERIAEFVRAGGREEVVLIDPGIGFGKNLEHNLEILRRLEEFHALERPLVLGASRKSFIGRLLSRGPVPLDPVPTSDMSAGTGPAENCLGPADRLEGSLAVACRAVSAGVSILRVHDVAATRRALTVFDAISTRSVSFA